MQEKQACQNPAVKPKRNRILRGFLMIAGTISLVFAAIGVVLPLIPTTPLLLLAVACYCRSSERMYSWLLNNRMFGEYIRNYKEGRGIPLKTKATALAILWLTIGASTLLFVPILIIQIALLVVAVAVTVHILRIPTYRKK